MAAVWLDDLYRYTGKRDRLSLIKEIIKNHEFRLVWLLRKCNTRTGFLYRLPYRAMSRKYGIDLSPKTSIGKGFYMGHAYGITINSHAVFGDNINIHKGATVGRTNRGERKGSPTLGSNVFIGINSTVVGKITIGDDVLIAPNTYVNRDVPSHSMVFGNPMQIIAKENATEDYVNRRV